MVTELRDLMRQTAEAPTAEPVVVTSILGQAKGRVRRRRTAMVGGAAAVSALSVVAVVAGMALSHSDLAPADPVTATNDIVGPVTHLDSSVDAVEGKDYEVLTTYTNDNLDRANGRSFSAITPDGLVLYDDGPFGLQNRTEIGVLDPETGETSQPFPAAIGESGAGAAVADDDWIVWSSSDGPVAFWVVDRATGEATPIRVDDIVTGSGITGTGGEPYVVRGELGPDDRLYFTVEDMNGSIEQSTLVSVSLTGELDAQVEGQVGSWSVTGRRLVFTVTRDRPDSTVNVRDLTTGEETSFDAQSGAHCNVLGLSAAPDRVVLSQYCGQPGGVRDDRVQVVTMDGSPVTTIQGPDVQLVGTSERFLTLTTYGDNGGVYAYELASGRLLKLADGSPKFFSYTAGAGDLLSWGTPVNDGHGMKLWVARFK